MEKEQNGDQPVVNGQQLFMVSGEQIEDFARAMYKQITSEQEKSDDEILLTPQQTMDLIGVSRTTLWKWEQSGTNLQPHRLGKRCYYFRNEVYEYLKNH